MFSEACVKNSVNRGGGKDMYSRGACVVGGNCAWQGCVSGRGVVSGGVHGRGHMWHQGMHDRGRRALICMHGSREHVWHGGDMRGTTRCSQ